MTAPGLVGDKIYGKRIDQLHMTEDGVPVFVPVVARFIRDFAVNVGVFRRCGDHTLIQDMGVLFSHKKVSMPPFATVYDACSFLKQWMKLLPEPLITPSVFNAHFNPQNPDSVRIVLQNLAEPNRKTYAHICLVLRDILYHKDANQMDFKNISFCFFGTFTQNSKNLSQPFPCHFFYMNSMLLMNEEKLDFDLDEEIPSDVAIPMATADAPAVFNMEQYTKAIQDAEN